ncbi:amidase [Limnoglobus roseus]|uniref:Amidase n=1 Tax=Limnoglobus roseus TaxID=2598579 RepID=A0A5C1A762_9BACT|nr:amidase [Limnoglobus roseus]QEL15041.1 amidase [Limnoglobus roseus]
MPDRRELLTTLAGLGVGTTIFQRALVASAQENPTGITAEMVKNAEWVAGITLSDEQRAQVATVLTRTAASLKLMAAASLGNEVLPAVHFNPAPGLPPHVGPLGTVTPTTLDAKKPDAADDLAFAPLTLLAHLVRTKQVSSVELTKFYLERLKKFDPLLKCVVSFTDDLAMKQAEAADKEIAAGKYRGPLHGIPWGAKDLISYPGYKTTWGAEHYKDQTLDGKATVAKKVEDAGAVMVAKTTLGALAMGDEWFGGKTKNPWNPVQGSSGSSAGSASSVAAGLVGFAIGSETLGSIVSPSTRCGVTGLRPTFGRVSRHGCLALTWTMDKIGPMARSVEDCALIFGAIHGSDANDPVAVDRPFEWPGKKPLKELRVGVQPTTPEKTRKVLTDLGVKLVPIKLPNEAYTGAVSSVILNSECASAFDDLTRAGVKDGLGTYATTFRAWRFISAVDYLRANRLRAKVMELMAKAIEGVDVYVGGNDLVLTNLTGHPTVCLPNGFTQLNGVKVPTAITFVGQLYGESDLLTVAKAYQDATAYHKERPPLKVD